ncbi:MAG: hypothetical protein R6X02_10030, partial [Enhygromyxa sp.]
MVQELFDRLISRCGLGGRIPALERLERVTSGDALALGVGEDEAAELQHLDDREAQVGAKSGFSCLAAFLVAFLAAFLLAFFKAQLI